MFDFIVFICFIMYISSALINGLYMMCHNKPASSFNACVVFFPIINTLMLPIIIYKFIRNINLMYIYNELKEL